MFRLNFNLCLIALALITPHLVSSEDDGKTKFAGDEEVLPSEQTIDSQDDSTVANKESGARSAARPLRESFTTDFNRNMEANSEFAMQDGQESSASNKVVLVLNNDKNKFGEFVKPAEESLRRLTRNPDAIDDIIGQFQQLGGDMTQQFMQQVSQTAPDISKSFGQALNEVLTQTNMLVSPVSLNLQNLSESNGFDLAQLGQNFLVGATQNLFNQNKDPAESESAAPLMPGMLGPATPPNTKAATSSDQAGKNPFENLVGQPFLPQFPQLPQFGQLNPFGMFAQFSALAPPLVPTGSEISEVRVLPEQYAPYKLTPKQVDLQTMPEMKLKAALKEALTKKTIPILWFHMPTNHKLSKTSEDMLMETKLQMFEHQVINDLKQLQELAKMANEMKRAQLESGAQPTESLTTKLNLFEIPVYDITLGDIERTAQDEHVKMLMQTLIQQRQSTDFQRHQQATTKYLTDLTGAPIKRQAKMPEETLNRMEKDDIMKMMAYAYRMASLHGHEMPWLKRRDTMRMTEEKDAAQTSLDDREQKSTHADVQMNADRKWLEDKQKQMAFEEAKQRNMLAYRQGMMAPNPRPHWTDPSMVQQQQQMAMQRQMRPPQMPHELPHIPRNIMPSPMSHPMPQQMPQPMPQPMPIPNQMVNLDTKMQQPDMQKQMMPQPMMANVNMQQEPIPLQRQQQQPPTMRMPWPEPPTGQQFQRQLLDTNMPEAMIVNNPKRKKPPHTINLINWPQPMMSNVNMQEQLQREEPGSMMMPAMRTFAEQNPQQRSNFRSPQPMMANAYMPEQRAMTMSDMRNSNFGMQQPMMQEQMNMQRQQQEFQRQSEPTQPFDSKMPEQATNFTMSQATMPNSNTQPTRAMQRQQEQAIVMPEMRPPTTEQRPPTESKWTEQAAGFGADVKPLTDSMKTPEQMQRVDAETPGNAANTNPMPMDHMRPENEAKPQMPENEEKARFKGVEKLFDKLDLFGNRHHHGWHSVKQPYVHNYYYNAGGGHYKPGYGHAGGHGYAHHPPPLPPHHHHPAPSYYGGGAYGSNAYGPPYGAYRAAVGDEEIAAMLQQQQQPLPVTFFRK